MLGLSFLRKIWCQYRSFFLYPRERNRVYKQLFLVTKSADFGVNKFNLVMKVLFRFFFILSKKKVDMALKLSLLDLG